MMLSDLIVLDLSRHLPGPFATLMLADLGAKVIKIEDPQGGDVVRWSPPFINGTSALFLQLNRNKRSLTLNFKVPQARQAFIRLVQKADIVIESFRPSVTQRLGIDYPTLQALNPRLIYCSITGYGQDGPLRDRAGHDLNYVARAGVLGLNTDANGTPVLPSVQIADLASGSLPALVQILAALHARERSGEGKYIDVSMADGALSLLPVAFSHIMAGEPVGVGEKMELNGQFPFYNIYRTADGKFLALAAIEPKFWENFCRAIERPDLISQHFATGTEQQKLFQELRGTLASRSQSDWLQAFEGIDVCCEPVQSLEEVVSDKHFLHRGMVQECGDAVGGKVKQLGSPLKISGIQEISPTPAPQLGEHNSEILLEIGFSDEDIQKLKSIGAI
jgi:crotonobetainyl-CoA:carnitine CoA-transferase CaiB-like acyl-CoA transferase